ncbi:hypothetical protein [Arcobacter porcinus]|uniref:hypothetical protein n=1 Tax=Arcobacter porcinus TaxID=1935204 RepID=UPI00081E0F16|nr:hypothetical protein [Arcobacter porcinus]OCL84850.1 hypothetical protein AAW29_00529 [Arcobacter porcinus]
MDINRKIKAEYIIERIIKIVEDREKELKYDFENISEKIFLKELVDELQTIKKLMNYN